MARELNCSPTCIESLDGVATTALKGRLLAKGSDTPRYSDPARVPSASHSAWALGKVIFARRQPLCHFKNGGFTE